MPFPEIVQLVVRELARRREVRLLLRDYAHGQRLGDHRRTRQAVRGDLTAADLLFDRRFELAVGEVALRIGRQGLGSHRGGRDVLTPGTRASGVRPRRLDGRVGGADQPETEGGFQEVRPAHGFRASLRADVAAHELLERLVAEEIAHGRVRHGPGVRGAHSRLPLRDPWGDLVPLHPVYWHGAGLIFNPKRPRR